MHLTMSPFLVLMMQISLLSHFCWPLSYGTWPLTTILQNLQSSTTHVENEHETMLFLVKKLPCKQSLNLFSPQHLLIQVTKACRQSLKTTYQRTLLGVHQVHSFQWMLLHRWTWFNSTIKCQCCSSLSSKHHNFTKVQLTQVNNYIGNYHNHSRLSYLWLVDTAEEASCSGLGGLYNT